MFGLRRLTRLFNKRDLDPTLLSNDWLDGATASGIHVNKTTALSYAAVWRAVNMVSRDIARIPLDVYRREGDYDRSKDRGHPAGRLMRGQPNPRMTSYNFRQTMQAGVMLEGNAYAIIRRDGLGDITDLLPVPFGEIAPVIERDERGTKKLFYSWRPGSDAIVLQPDEVLHIRGLGDGLEGYSVLAHARESLGLGLAARAYGSVFFKNNARPNLVLEFPKRLSEQARRNIIGSFDSMTRGIQRAHRPVVLEDGLKMSHAVTINAADAQLLETRQFEIREIAAWFGLPAHKLGDTERTSFASLEQENLSYLHDIDGWLVNWEQECNAKLLTGKQRREESHFWEFNRSALVRVDLKTRFEAYNIAVRGGWMAFDEVRAKENDGPIPNGSGAKFVASADLVSLDSITNPVSDVGPADRSGLAARLALRQLVQNEVQKWAHTTTKWVMSKRADPREYFLRAEAIDVGGLAERLKPYKASADALGAAMSCSDISTRCCAVLSEKLLTVAECNPRELLHAATKLSRASRRPWLRKCPSYCNGVSKMDDPIRRAVLRPVDYVERAGGAPKIGGLAAVYYDGTPATEFKLFDDLVERIMPGAFDRALTEGQDVVALFNHEADNLLGRRSAGTMRLRSVAAGLHYEIDLADTRIGSDVAKMVQRGDLAGSSFAFIPRKVKYVDATDSELEVRQIEDVDLFDVGPVTYPAYNATSVESKSRWSQFKRMSAERSNRVRALSIDCKRQS